MQRGASHSRNSGAWLQAADRLRGRSSLTRNRGPKGSTHGTRSQGHEVKAGAAPGPLFKSFFAAGFECSTHLRRSGWRLDLIAATAHDKFAGPDYARLTQEGIRVTREGVRWHLVEDKPGHYDFSSVLPIVRAARATQTQVIWDLCHFGWPDHLDLFAPEFVSSLASYGAAFVRWLGKELEQVPFIVP